MLSRITIPNTRTSTPPARIKADGSPLDLKREYIRNGIRSIAEDLCTGQNGHRNQVDAMTAERREIQECRYTSLDRMITGRTGSGRSMGAMTPATSRFAGT